MNYDDKSFKNEYYFLCITMHPFYYNLMNKLYFYFKSKMVVIFNKHVYPKNEKNKSIDKLNKSFIIQKYLYINSYDVTNSYHNYNMGLIPICSI